MLKTLISATVIAATAALATVPAQASSGLSIELRAGQGAPVVQIDGRGPHWGRGPDRGRDWGRRDVRLSARDVHRSLRERGYERIDVRDARGPVYVVFATSRRSGPVKLTVNAYNGSIIDQQRLGRRW